MANRSLPEVQKDIKEICEYYTKLTSTLLLTGYETFLSQMKSLSELECMEMITKMLDAISEFIDEAQAVDEEDYGDEENDTLMRMIRGLSLRESHDQSQSAAANYQQQELLNASLNASQNATSFGSIDKQKLHRMVKKTLEKSLTESIMPSLEQHTSRRPRSQKSIENEAIMKMNEDARLWRERTFHASDRPSSWNTMTRQQRLRQAAFERDFIDKTLSPNTSARGNTAAINVESLDIEI
jgi:hypothetical protein